MKEKVTIYTDGSALGAPGKGGYAAIIIKEATFDKNIIKLSGGFKQTTNNRMELMALIIALERIGNIPQDITIYSDSKYLIDCFNCNWLEKWEKDKWKTSLGTRVKNRDLWKRLEELLKEHKVNFVWVKGHAGNKYNMTCDRMANDAANKPFHTLKTDYGYLHECELDKKEEKRKKKKKERRKAEKKKREKA